MTTFGQNWMGPVNQFGGLGQSEWDKLFADNGLFGTVDGTKDFLTKSDSEDWDQYRDRLASTLLGQLGGAYLNPEARQRFGQNLGSLQNLANLKRMLDPNFASNPSAGTGDSRSNLQHYLQTYLQGGDLAKATGFGGDFNSVFGDLQRGAAGATTDAAKDAYSKYARQGLQELAARQMGGAPGAAAQGMLGQIFGAGTNPGATWWGQAAASPYAGMFGFASGTSPTQPVPETTPTPPTPETTPTVPVPGATTTPVSTGVVGNTGGGITQTRPSGSAASMSGGVTGPPQNAPTGTAKPQRPPTYPDPVLTADVVIKNNPFQNNWDTDTTIEALNDFMSDAGRPPTTSELLEYLRTHYGDRRKTVSNGSAGGMAGAGPTLGAGTGVRA